MSGLQKTSQTSSEKRAEVGAPSANPGTPHCPASVSTKPAVSHLDAAGIRPIDTVVAAARIAAFCPLLPRKKESVDTLVHCLCAQDRQQP